MKTKTIILSVVIVALLGSAYKVADDILSKLGMDEDRITFALFSNLVNAQPRKPDCEGSCDGFNLQIPKATLLPSIIKGDKTGAAKELCAYIKQYCESKEFNQAYQKERKDREPRGEKPRKIDQGSINSLKSTIAMLEESSKDLEQAGKNANNKVIADIKRQIKEASDPMPQTTKWKEKYPELTNTVVTKALKYYLSEQATVDFAAQTKVKGEKKVFVNTKYEGEKTKTWKAIYRAGKEVNNVVKVFVTEWLKQGVHTSTEPLAAGMVKKENKSTPETSKTVEPANAKPEETKTSVKEEKKSIFNKLKDQAKKVLN